MINLSQYNELKFKYIWSKMLRFSIISNKIFSKRNKYWRKIKNKIKLWSLFKYRRVQNDPVQCSQEKINCTRWCCLCIYQFSLVIYIFFCVKKIIFVFCNNIRKILWLNSFRTLYNPIPHTCVCIYIYAHTRLLHLPASSVCHPFFNFFFFVSIFFLSTAVKRVDSLWCCFQLC